MYDSQEEGNSDSDTDSDSSSLSDSIEENNLLQEQMPGLLGDEVDDSDDECGLNMTEYESTVQKDLFVFFNSLISLAVDYIKTRFDKFRQDPLRKFQQVFNVLTVITLSSKKEIRRFARDV